MNTRQLHYAVELSKSLNFSTTAKLLGITQPALSKQILHLEEEIGVKLFDRATLPLMLTPAGEHFIERVQSLLYHEDQLLKSMEEFKSGERGNLVIGISPFRATYLMPSLIKKIKDEFPNIKIVLNENTSDEIRNDAIDGKFDFAIVNLPVNDTLLDVTLLEPDTMVLAVPNEYLTLINKTAEANLEKIDFSTCSSLPFITVTQTQEMGIFFEEMCQNAKFIPNISAEVKSLTAALAMVNAGVGATVLPLQFLEGFEKNNNISLFVIKNITRVRQPVIITKKGQYLSKQAKFAIDLLTRK